MHDQRVSGIEANVAEHHELLSLHGARLEALERLSGETLEFARQSCNTSKATQKVVMAMVPEVFKLKKNSRALKRVKIGGGGSLLLVLGALLENYGPALVKLILGSGN